MPGQPSTRPQPTKSYRIPLSDEQMAFCGHSCRLLFTEIGIGSASTYLFSILREHIPLTRIFCGFRPYKLAIFTPVADTLPDTHNRVLTLATSTMPQEQIDLMMGSISSGEIAPYTIANAPPPTSLQTIMNIEDLASCLRIPLFIVGEAVFQIAFCSNIAGAFSEGIAKPIITITRPLGDALRELFTHTGNAPLAESRHTAGSATKRLALCPGLSDLRRQIEQVAPTDSTVLILGETGTGKELVADALHELSARSGQPFIKVNCGAVHAELADSEFFGHEKGAFVGAYGPRAGFFEAANGGTIFLDEIGDLPLTLQARLLRVLDRREIQRVGGLRAIPLELRVIAATHRDLTEMIRKGQFREDLWFRLNAFVLKVPPLREHRMDIPPLAQFFLNTRARPFGITPPPAITPEQAEKLCRHNWPGNVRELEHLVERVLVRSRVLGSPFVLPFDLELKEMRSQNLSAAPFIPPIREGATPPAQLPAGQEPSLAATPAADAPQALRALTRHATWPSLKEVTQAYIEDALRKTGGRISGPDGAAALLGVHPNTLRTRKAKANG